MITVQNYQFAKNTAYEARWETEGGEIGFELQIEENPGYPWVALYRGEYLTKASGKVRRFGHHGRAVSAAREMCQVNA